MVLSGDEILMTETGSLGPIDAQVRIGRSVISAFDYIEWTTDKMEEAQQKGKLNPFDATIVAQISPGELSSVNNALKYAQDLVTSWLAQYKFKNWKETETSKTSVTVKMRKDRAKAIAQELTNHAKWRTHGRSIKAKDLIKIGVKITEVEKNPELKDIIYRIQAVCRLLFYSTNAYKIFATEDAKIFKNAMSKTSPEKLPGAGQADVGAFDVKCPQCGKVNKLYGKFKDDPNIDNEFQAKGLVAFPKDNKLKCECKFEIDLLSIRNEIETKIGKKIL